MKMATNDEHNQTQEFTSYITTQDPNGVKTMDELVNDIYSNVFFKLFCSSIVIHILVLAYCLRFKWNYRSWWELKFYIPRIRKYVGGLLATFSFIISFITMVNMGTSEKTQLSVIGLLFFSSFLTLFAAFLAYGFKGTPNTYVGIHTIVLSLLICIAAKSFADGESTQQVLAQAIFGSFHILIGILLIVMSCKDENVPGLPWNQRNGFMDE